MRILLIGLGSIGKRHLNNIIHLGYKKLSVVTRSAIKANELKDITFYSSIDEACFVNHFDAAIICTPTSHHISDLEKIIKYQIKNIYLEKPVSHNYLGIDNMLELIEKNKCRIIIGYDLHFDPGLEKVKEIIKNNGIGKLVSINASVGQYLPDWRPEQNYTQGVSAKKEMGGGVLLDLIHEFDYVYRLMGNVKTIGAHYIHSSTLNIETEDVAEAIFSFDNGAIGTIHLDYLQPYTLRYCIITGNMGSIFWNMAKKEVSWNNHNKDVFNYSYTEFERNNRFKKIMKIFLNGKNDNRLTTFKEALISLRMVLAAKHSAENQVFVQFNQFLMDRVFI